MEHEILLNGISSTELIEGIVSRLKTEFISQQAEHSPEADDAFLTSTQVSAILGVSLVTLCKWRKEGKIKFHRFGSRIRYRRSEIADTKKYQAK